MQSRNYLLVAVCALIAAAVFLVRWQGPSRPAVEKRTPAGQHQHAHKSAFASVAAHHETTDSDGFLFASGLEKAVTDSEVETSAASEAVARLRDLAGRAEPPSEFRTEARAFSNVADANRFLHQRQFRCQVAGEGLEERQRVLIGWMDEIVFTGERAQIQFRDRRCAAVRVKGEMYEMGVRPVIKLLLPSPATIYLTGFGALDSMNHHIALDDASEQIRIPPEQEAASTGWVIIPALHAHVCHRVKSLEGPAIFRAISAFSIKCQWPPGPVSVADGDSVILNDHFNIVIARDQSPFLCFHIGPWAFTPEPDVL